MNQQIPTSDQPTVTGTLSHKKVHAVKDVERSTGREVRGLRLISHQLRVQGVADLVEYRDGVPAPVEYKQGKRRRWDNDDVQLCAQAICLEEMLNVEIPAGAIYHVLSKRRRDITFTPKLRQLTHDAARRLHEVLAITQSPAGVHSAKCKGCSFHELCLPEIVTDLTLYKRQTKSLFDTPKS